jgi:HK97 family phage prohead protease
MGVAPLELRQSADGSELEIAGYASVFNEPYAMVGYTEEVAKGAFRRTLNNNPPPDVVPLVNHEGLPLARTRSGNLTLNEDETGLRVKATLDPADPDVKNVEIKMQRGDLSEMSFSFVATDQEWSEDFTKRVLRAVEIHRGDVSLVTNAANPAATATLREDELTLEQRQVRAERIGNRVYGPAIPFELRASIAPEAFDASRHFEEMVAASPLLNLRPLRPATDPANSQSAAIDRRMREAIQATANTHERVRDRQTRRRRERRAAANGWR